MSDNHNTFGGTQGSQQNDLKNTFGGTQDSQQSDLNKTFGASFDGEYDESDVSSKLEPGMVFCEKYRLEKQAGRGGMGEIWKAYDTIGERYVALKFVPRDIQRHEEEMLRVKETFKTIHELNHQNICPVYSMENDPVHGFYLVMKWLVGYTLDEIHQRNAKEGGRLPIQYVPKLLECVADALDYAHKQKVVHRDVKPSNIFVRLKKGQIEEVSLIDFGLATEIRESMTRVSQVKINTSGTRPYMPPEQWRGRKQDAKTDQYSLAVVAYELYAGNLPFSGSDAFILRNAILNFKPERIEGIPDYINDALQKALAKDREDRFESCGEFIKALSNQIEKPLTQESQIENKKEEKPKSTPEPSEESNKTATDNKDAFSLSDKPQSNAEPSPPPPTVQVNKRKITRPVIMIGGGILLMIFAVFMFVRNSLLEDSPSGAAPSSGRNTAPLVVSDNSEAAVEVTSGDVVLLTESDSTPLAVSNESAEEVEVTLGDPSVGETIWKQKDFTGKIAFSPDGRFLAVSARNDIKILDFSTGKLLHTLEGHTGDIYSVSYSPNGNYVVSGSWDKTVRIWNANSGECVNTLEGHTKSVSSVSYSPDGKYIATGSWEYNGDDKTVRIWDASSGECVKMFEGHTKSVRSVSYSPDGKYIATGNADKTVRICNVSSGKCVKTLEGHTKSVRSVSYSPDGKYIVSGGYDGTVRIWDVSSVECVKTPEGQSNNTKSENSSSIGNSIATGSDDKTGDDGRTVSVDKTRSVDKTTQIQDASSGERVKTLEGHTDYVLSVCYSPNGKYIASGGVDENIRIWDASSGECVKTFEGHTDRVLSVCYSPDGYYIASGSMDRTVRIWDISNGECVKTLKGRMSWFYSVNYSPDGKFIASGSEDNTVRIWDTSNGECVKTLKGHKYDVYFANYSPDGKFIASGGGDENIRIWDASSGECVQLLKGNTNHIFSVSYSPSGKYIASGSMDNTVKIWNTTSGECVKTLIGHKNNVRSVSYSPDGKYIVSGSEDSTVRIWDASSDFCVRTLCGHTDGILSVSYSLGGKFIASGSMDDTVRIWDVSSIEHVKTPEGQSNNTISENYSPYENSIATGSDEKAGGILMNEGQVAGERKVITVDGVEYAFRWCPPGEFMMGSPTSEAGRKDNETQHRVRLTKGFWLLETEVTQEMWESVMGNNPSHFKGANLPVEQVNWTEAGEFCKKLSGFANMGTFSLPTEAQWEYACRAGTTGEFGGTGKLDEMGWYHDNSGNRIHAVKSKKPNAWGLYDMRGNVWELCSDWHGPLSEGKCDGPNGA